jgi:hypothetical protein
MMAMRRKPEPSRGDLLDAAFRTAVDYVDHQKYGTESRALASLRRRCPGFTPAQYRNALALAMQLLESVEPVIEPFSPPYDNTPSAAQGWPRRVEAVHALKRRFPAFRLSTCASAILWVLFWRHWK